ncbi:hypothetical protein RQP46_009533 [Phenoliferia psychrophenolica]
MARHRAEFSSLPIELKSRIFELVAWQEDAWKARFELDEKGMAPEKTTHVDGLVASSAVSKEWRSFAAEHLFSTVSAERAQLPVFKYHILRKYGHRFTRVVLEDAAEGIEEGAAAVAWDYLFSIIPILPNVCSLALSDTAAYALFGRALELDDDPDSNEPQKVARVLALWPSLRRLCLQNMSLDPASPKVDGLTLLANGLTKMTRLEHLDMEFHPTHSGEGKIWPAPALLALRETPPPISTLRLNYHKHTSSDSEFILTFASNLKHIDLTFDSVADSFTPAPSEPLDPPHQATLPILATLSLTFTGSVDRAIQPTTLSRLLPSFTSSPLTSLVIRDDVGVAFNNDDRCPLRLLADHFPDLRHFSIDPHRLCLDSDELNYVAAFCARRNLSPPSNTPFDHTHFIEGLRDTANNVDNNVLVAWQEDAWQARCKVDVDLVVEGKEGRVNGLVAVSAVSKEWRSFAVEHLFSLPIFKYHILRKYGRRFTRVVLEDAAADVEDAEAEAAWDHLFSLIPLLPNVRSLTLSDTAAYGLFGSDLDLDEDPDADEPQGMRAAVLRETVKNISDVTLADFYASEAAIVLAAWPSLRRLTLRNVQFDDTSTKAAGLTLLANSLTKMTRLEHLELEFTIDESGEARTWPAAALLTLRDTPPPISTLRLSSHTHTSSDSTFIFSFASTLQKLDLTLYTLSNSFTLVPSEPLDPLQATLPILTTLSLTFTGTVDRTIHPTTFSRLLPSFTSSPLTSLVLRDEIGVALGVDEYPPRRLGAFLRLGVLY